MSYDMFAEYKLQETAQLHMLAGGEAWGVTNLHIFPRVGCKNCIMMISYQHDCR